MPFPFKHLIRKGEKYIVVENGKPEYVMMHYDDYAEMMGRSEIRATSQGSPAASDDFVAETAFSGQNIPEDISKIRLEDLPL